MLAQTAAEESLNYRGIKGQVAIAANVAVGRFGWRGQTATLREFVLGACANELGLQVPGSDQPLDPLDPTHKSPGLDMTQEQCDELVAFVASLPAPSQRMPSDAKEAARVRFGERLFQATGCAACHRQTLGNVNGIYSDLLLHDMGGDLADPLPATPKGRTRHLVPRTSGGAYYGPAEANDIFVDVPAEPFRQWRTPPLWGVADSAPYLHDGRAATLQDAITAHGGEAGSARDRYMRLSAGDRAKLLAFLSSLKAPQ